MRNTVIVTMSLNFAPASASVLSMLRKVCLNWASKSPASDLPASSVCPVCPAMKMVRPAPSAMTAGENARLTCQVPRTNDFFIGVLLSLFEKRSAHGELICFRSSPRKRGPSRSWIPAISAFTRVFDALCAGMSGISLGQTTETIPRPTSLRVAIAHRAPEPLRRGRHLDVADAEVGEGVNQRIGDRGHGADAARFARALDPERIGPGRHRIALYVDRADVGRARHGIVHERAGQVLAVAIELDVLHQDLADALGDAADDLSLQQQRIDDRADVVHDAVADDLDLAGVLVDLELADVAAVGEVLHRRGIGRGRDQTHVHALGKPRRLHRLLRDVLDGQRAIGLGAGEHAVGKVDIGGVEVEEMGGDRFGLGGDPLGGGVDCRSTDGRRARAAGALADEHLIGVALDVVDLVRVEPEPVARDLLEDRLVALALGDAAGEQRDRAGFVEPDLGALEALRGRALDGVGEADAAQLAALRASTRRRSKPAKSASASAMSMLFSNSPLS